MPDTIIVTGAFGYTGKYATLQLLARGFKVRTLTSHPNRGPALGREVEAFPYNFDRPDQLEGSLQGASTLINTYWVRFPFGATNFERAVRNTEVLIEAANRAGIRRIVHVSIANSSLDSPLGYYRGKAQVERAVMDSGLFYGIVRPTVVFGIEDILINNIAWFVRKFPVFAIPGNGRYRVRPIYVKDLAALLVRAAENAENEILDAVGPETFAFEELVQRIGSAVGKSPLVLHVPASAAYAATRLIGWMLGDVILTWEEYQGLMQGLLAPEGPASGATKLTEWLAENGSALGRKYSSEIARHYGVLAVSM